MPIDFGNTNQRMYSCFVCAKTFRNFEEFKSHIFEKHEEGREYLVCPVKYCGCPARDLRYHFRTKHPSLKIPENIQLRATVMYDTKTPGKRRKVPNFKEGYIISEKNGKKVHYRSGYELEVYNTLEKIGEVLAYECEPFGIHYFYKGKRRQYFPDLKVVYSDGRVEIWEVKPANQTATDQNTAKFAAAEQYCKLRGWNFDVITEQRIQQLKKKT